MKDKKTTTVLAFDDFPTNIVAEKANEYKPRINEQFYWV